MNILINQTSHELPDGATLADAIAAVAARPPFAVAVNTVFVPNTHYADSCCRPATGWKSSLL
jgi:sulfur carrier protein